MTKWLKRWIHNLVGEPAETQTVTMGEEKKRREEADRRLKEAQDIIIEQARFTLEHSPAVWWGDEDEEDITSDRPAWSRKWVVLNTAATVFAAFTSLEALIVPVIALTS